MRIAELSERSGVPVPTIKYYVREGLLPPGRLTSPNQAQYDETHLHRLKLVRALVDVGELSIAETKDVLTSIASPGLTLHETLGKAQLATIPHRKPPVGEEALQAAKRDVDELIARRGWQVKPTNPAREWLAEVIAALRELGQEDCLAAIDVYADAVERVAEADMHAILGRPDLDSMLEGVVAGTILGDAMLAAMRRLAHANASAEAQRAPVRR
jgi:DNA-binding transcriptional MerR regulator